MAENRGGSVQEYPVYPGFFAALCLSALLSIGSAAAQITPAPAADDCRKTAGSEREMAACFGKLTKAQDATIAAAVRTLKARYADPSEKSFAPALDKAQRQWLAWRDAECALKTWESHSGSGYANILAACRHAETAARITTLQEMIDSP